MDGERLALEVALAAIALAGGVLAWRKGRNGHGRSSSTDPVPERLAHLEEQSGRALAEIDRLRERSHDMAGQVGAVVAISPMLNRQNEFGAKLGELAERVARLEGERDANGQ